MLFDKIYCVCVLFSEAVKWQVYVASVVDGRVGIRQQFPQCSSLTPRDSDQLLENPWIHSGMVNLKSNYFLIKGIMFCYK